MHADESLRLRRALGESPGLLRSLLSRGQGAVAAGDLVGARPFFHECRQLAEQVGDDWFTAIVDGALADMALQEGDFVQAERLAEQSYALLRDMGDEYMAWTALGNVASAQLELGKVRPAAKTLCDVLKTSVDAEAPEVTSFIVDCLAAVARRTGQDDLAVRLSGAVSAAWRSLGVAAQPFEDARRRRLLDAVGARLGAERVQALLAEGEAMALEDAVECALTLDPDGAEAPPASD